jgi:hypothetical protein
MLKTHIATQQQTMVNMADKINAVQKQLAGERKEHKAALELLESNPDEG